MNIIKFLKRNSQKILTIIAVLVMIMSLLIAWDKKTTLVLKPAKTQGVTWFEPQKPVGRFELINDFLQKPTLGNLQNAEQEEEDEEGFVITRPKEEDQKLGSNWMFSVRLKGNGEVKDDQTLDLELLQAMHRSTMHLPKGTALRCKVRLDKQRVFFQILSIKHVDESIEGLKSSLVVFDDYLQEGVEAMVTEDSTLLTSGKALINTVAPNPIPTLVNKVLGDGAKRIVINPGKKIFVGLSEDFNNNKSKF